MTTLKIFVTGASGFVGRAFVTRMLEQGHHIVAVYGPLSPTNIFNCLPDEHQSNLSNLRLNLLDQQEILPYISGCDCVVHLAHNYQDTLREQFVFATRSNQTLLQTCVEAQVKKFVHISSTSVYGDPSPSCVITEESPHLASIRPHTSIKQAAEKLVLETEASGSEVIVLQLGMVYGPGDRGKTAQTLNQMKTAFMPLARYGAGYCNPIYIDDVVTAITYACKIPNLNKQCFIISNDQPITWKNFLSYYESILGEKTLINLPINYLCEPQASVPFCRELASKILRKRKVMEGTSAIAKAFRGKPIHYPSSDEFCASVAQPIFSNQKASDHLSFEPEISLQTGVDRIRKWWNQQSLQTK